MKFNILRDTRGYSLTFWTVFFGFVPIPIMVLGIELVRSVLKKEQFSRAESIFATENDLSGSPLGSPITISPQAAVVMTLEECMTQRGINRNEHRRRREDVPDNQLMLPF